jgi:FkbM family methyltransferase
MKDQLRKLYSYLRRRVFAGRGLSKIAFIKNANFALEKFLKAGEKGSETGFTIDANRALKEFMGLADVRSKRFDWTRGGYEPAETDFIEKNLRAGDCFVDIGANAGWYTLIAAKTVGASGAVYSFEPDERNLAKLNKNVKDGAFSNVTVVPKAVSDRSGKQKMFMRNNSTMASSFYDPLQDPDKFIEPYHGAEKEKTSVEEVEIATITLDDYFREGRPIDMIKMDVEGAEPLVVKGAKRVFAANRDIKIVSEFCPAVIEATGGNAEEYLRTLIDMGFSLYEIDERHQQLAAMTIPDLLRKYTPAKNNGTNLVFKRG